MASEMKIDVSGVQPTLSQPTPMFFASPRAFRAWLGANGAREASLVVGFYKVGTGLDRMSWSESVDEALCFGWVDGVRRRIDEQSYSIRFTPRRKSSIWSVINIAGLPGWSLPAWRASACAEIRERGPERRSGGRWRDGKRNNSGF